MRDVKTGDVSQIDVGGVFIYVGFMPNSQIFGDGFPKDPQGFVITDDKMETHIPGLYVAATCAASTCARSRTRSATRRRRQSPPRATSKSSTRPATSKRPSRPSELPSVTEREFVTVAHLSDVPPGAVRAVQAGDRWYALVNLDGRAARASTTTARTTAARCRRAR